MTYALLFLLLAAAYLVLLWVSEPYSPSDYVQAFVLSTLLIHLGGLGWCRSIATAARVTWREFRDRNRWPV